MYDISDLSGCSAITASKCLSTNDEIFEAINEIYTTESCQFYCTYIYPDKCKYFMFDHKQKTCTLLSSDFQYGDCLKYAGGITTDVASCNTVFNDTVEEHECLVSLPKVSIFDYTMKVIFLSRNNEYIHIFCFVELSRTPVRI